MNGLIYEAPFENVALTDSAGGQDILMLTASADTPFVLHYISLTSDNLADVRARLELVERTTSGSGQTALTEVPRQRRNTTAADTVVVRTVTTPGTAGDLHEAEFWSLLIQYKHEPTPALQIQVPAGERIALHLADALGQAETISGTVIWEEF